MLSSEYDMFEQGIVVRVNETGKDAASAEEMSKFVGSWHKPLSEEIDVSGREHGFIAERSYFDDSDSIESDSGSEGGRISHPSISSTSSSPDRAVPIKYELRDPGVIPRSTPQPSPVPPRDNPHIGPVHQVTNTTSLADQGHYRAASDTIIHSQKNTTKSPRRSLGLSRQKAGFYAKVPLLLLLSPEPCSLPPSRHQFSTATAAKVSMESIRPKSSKNSKVVATQERVTRKSTLLYKRHDENIGKGKGEKGEEFGTKIVCGLPCTSKEREEELKYTLEILSGTGIRRVEEDKPRIRNKVV